MNDPTFSILMKTRRHHRIPFVMNMIQNQTVQPKEIIIGIDITESVDQGDWYSLYPELFDDRVQLMFFDDETGGYTMNRLYEHATGDFVSIWDDDDFYAPEWLEMAKRYIEERNAVYLGSDLYLRWFDGLNELRVWNTFRKNEYIRMGSMGSFVFKRLNELPCHDGDHGYEERGIKEMWEQRGKRLYLMDPRYWVKGIGGDKMSFYRDADDVLGRDELIKNTEVIEGIGSEKALIDFVNDESRRLSIEVGK